MADIKKVKLSELIPDPNNANKGTERGRYMLEHSITNLGAGRSALVDKNNVLIAGNKTVEVAVESGFENAIIVETDGTELVVVKRSDLDLSSDDKAKQLAIADNRVGQINLNFDAEVLLDLDREIDLSAYFTDEEFNELSLTIEDEEKSDRSSSTDDEIPEVTESRVKPGDIWQLGRHFICAGDCTVEENVRKLLSFVGGRSPDMVWSDVPYGVNESTNRREKGRSNVTKSSDFAPILGDENPETAKISFVLYSKLFPDATHFWWGANYYPDVLPAFPSWIVWDKKEDTGSDDNADCELAWSNHGKPARIIRHLWRGMIKASEQGERRVHPSQKPIFLAQKIFEDFGSSGDLIIDPFLGSGISVLAAERIGDRVVVGFELSEHYCETIIKRWESLDANNRPIKVGTL